MGVVYKTLVFHVKHIVYCWGESVSSGLFFYLWFVAFMHCFGLFFVLLVVVKYDLKFRACVSRETNQAMIFKYFLSGVGCESDILADRDMVES